MGTKLSSSPLPEPSASLSVTADVVVAGQPIPAIDRIKLFSDRQWEEFILEWADSLRKIYQRVERCGGSGDMGRDVIAYHHAPSTDWDNYQCKHYGAPLIPTDIWVELGKLVYYTRRGDYTYPRSYTFVAPQGAGTKLAGLLKNGEKLRAELFANWDTYCRTHITKTENVDLDDGMRRYIEALDFSIFTYIPPLRVIDEHSKTRSHVARFGGGLPQRPPVPAPPAVPGPLEATYLRQLLDAYGDHLKKAVASPDELPEDGELRQHLVEAREHFYSAESLRAFSRDTLPPDEFEKLQDEFYVGVIDEVRADHADGYRRVIAVVGTAKLLPITAHALVTRLTMRDKGGVCHQLANSGRIRWVK
jgi:hypothetical protein